MNPAGVYLSVPFCRQKCSYCNFASDAHTAALLPRYLRALETEILHRPELWTKAQIPAYDDASVNSIYLGGGTPGMLAGEQLARLLHAVGQSFHLEGNAEVTLEASPENATAANAGGWAAAGINRVSLGVQSMAVEELRAVGRKQDAATVAAAFSALRSAGINNISADLIAGLPHQTLVSWQQSLRSLLDLQPDHVSVYLLEADEDSRLGREILAKGRRYHAADVPGEDMLAEFYALAIDFLRDAGLEQYEISNFCRPGRESRHNEKYWTGAPYFGFGIDAHSYDGTSRWANTESLDGYCDAAETLTPALAERSQLQRAGKTRRTALPWIATPSGNFRVRRERRIRD